MDWRDPYLSCLLFIYDTPSHVYMHFLLLISPSLFLNQILFLCIVLVFRLFFYSFFLHIIFPFPITYIFLFYKAFCISNISPFLLDFPSPTCSPNFPHLSFILSSSPLYLPLRIPSSPPNIFIPSRACQLSTSLPASPNQHTGKKTLYYP